MINTLRNTDDKNIEAYPPPTEIISWEPHMTRMKYESAPIKLFTHVVVITACK